MTNPPELQLALPLQPQGYRHRFHAMVKPIGSQCNLACTYCYYLHKGDLLCQSTASRMSDEILEQHIRQYIEAQTGEQVIFSWQGGEPTMLGLDFFHKVVELQAHYKKPLQGIDNDLQTNGTLLDADWVAFLKKHNFLVGLSCDGPARLHDRYRLSKTGEPTHARVMAAARLLGRFEVPFNALCVVNRENSQYPLDVYRFLTRELRVTRLQFISCVEPRAFDTTAPQHWDSASLPIVGTPQAGPDAEDSVVTPWSVAPGDWGRFLCKVWDDWYRRDYGKVHVDLFETAIAQSLGWPSQRCITAEFCGKGLAVEHNGEVFACDHYVYPEYRLGTILEHHWSRLAYSEGQKRFAYAKRNALPRYCRLCSYLLLCWGECPKNRLVRTPEGDAGLNYLCPGLKQFYGHIQRDMPEILARLRKAYQANT